MKRQMFCFVKRCAADNKGSNNKEVPHYGPLLSDVLLLDNFNDVSAVEVEAESIIGTSGDMLEMLPIGVPRKDISAQNNLVASYLGNKCLEHSLQDLLMEMPLGCALWDLRRLDIIGAFLGCACVVWAGCLSPSAVFQKEMNKAHIKGSI